MTFYNVSLPLPPIFSIKTHNSMHRLNINCSAGGVPPPPHPFPTWRRLFVSIWQCMFTVSDFECIWREQNKAWKGDRLLSRINTYKTIDPIRQQLRSPYTHHPPPPPQEINMAYCTCACACAYGYLNWGVIWRGVYTVSCHRTSNRVLFLDRYKT